MYRAKKKMLEEHKRLTENGCNPYNDQYYKNLCINYELCRIKCQTVATTIKTKIIEDAIYKSTRDQMSIERLISQT